MTVLTPNPLSGSTNGRGIKLTGTSSGAAVTIHTAVSGTTYADWVTLYAQNNDTTPIVLTICFGGTTDPDDLIKVSIPPQAGLVPVVLNLPIRNSLVVSGFAGTANKISIFGSAYREESS